jgi:DNA polymerase-3 subunit delta'
VTQSDEEDDGSDGAAAPHPRETRVLFGHAEAEQTLLDAYRSGRIPHGWLIGGPSGIGKATLAYRLARFVLAYPDPNSPAVQDATSLALPEGHLVAQRVAAQSQGDLLVLERTEGDTGRMRTVITVDQVRRTVSFFGSTAGSGGWRICIVDTADELQMPQAANALLKALEEPPPRGLILLLSQAPARLLPTIRSRSRRLTLRALSEQDVIRATAHAVHRSPEDRAIIEAASVAEGSVGRALALLEGPALALRRRLLDLLDRLPATDPQALHGLGDAIAGTEPQKLETFVDTVNAWLAKRLHTAGASPAQRARIAEAWEKVNAAAGDVDTYNLERKPFVFRTFSWLAEAARG